MIDVYFSNFVRNEEKFFLLFGFFFSAFIMPQSYNFKKIAKGDIKKLLRIKY
jgi:hypothetical protein